ncbi:retinal guanylyl cyclase 2 [Lasius niger]|uniref:Retinal guanylyl cyclase 2 n=1 Tax=Lasius niger TaxID=67767 RepID=A0A0J7JZH4_LASNI|nr:retinal guanylyl cyclase 2 [Lasius niger]
MLGDHSQSGVSCDSTGSQLPVIPSQDETPEESSDPVEVVQLDRQDSIDSNGVANGSDSRAASFEEVTGVRRVAVSVHNERTLLPSYSLRSTNDFIEVLQGKQDTAKTAETVHSGIVSKSTSGDTQASLGVSSSNVSGADPTAAILGASTSSLTSIAGSTTYRPPRHRRFGCIEENDLSTPYNHYRCLSPNEHSTHGTCLETSTS